MANATFKPSSAGNNKFVLSLLGATVLYQVVYQFFMHRALVESESSEDTCDGGPLTDSPRCVEVNLFRSWKDAEIHDHFDHSQPNLLKFVPKADAAKVLSYRAFRVPTLLKSGSDTSVGKSSSSIKSKFDGVYRDTLASIQRRSSITPWAKSVQASQVELESGVESLPSTQLHHREEREHDFDELYQTTLASIRNRSGATDWSKELTAIQRRFDDQMRHPPSSSKSDEERVKRSDDFDTLYQATLASLNKNSSTAWETLVESSEADLEARKESLRSARLQRREEREKRFNALYHEALSSIHDNTSVAEWANHLETIRRRFEGGDTTTTTTLGAHQKSLLDQIHDFQRELCESPEHRHLSACSEFVSIAEADGTTTSVAPRIHLNNDLAEHNAAFNSSLSEMRAEHDRWMLNFSHTGDSYIKDLCSDPSRKTYKACATFLADSSVASVLSPEKTLKSGRFVVDASTDKGEDTWRPSLRGSGARGTDSMLWSSVLESPKESNGAEKSSTVAVTTDELRAATWSGTIPKVACVAAVPVGRESRSRFADFLKEFREQTYEGASQLVLVYSSADKQMADLVRNSSDGTYIKAVATHDGLDPMSTVALRYGAWSSDADVIASWRFDERHHPDRLAMQVRALALARKPVSILKRWTLLSSDGNRLLDKVMSAEPGWVGSLVGEKSWMQKHWMPMLGNERDVLHGTAASDLVEVDMPELSVYAASGPHALADAKRHFGLL
eukprot:TRINITY_DN319_c0_g1_i2.p1 TRINITY_DN319_c0_g1~~TRINITY_DN319_c0_g1_i2.p1  ORF type:complete len:732 (-),score=118.32 TRINITY_DN319_c0_g1_i2:39-2234(-)